MSARFEMTHSQRSRRSALLLTAALLAGSLTAATPVSAGHYTGTEELTAEDNAGAAIAYSTTTFPERADAAVLGRDDDFADSLASGVLQATRPLLLTATDALSEATAAELERLNLTTVIILGGTGAVSEEVETALTDSGYEVERYAGANRIETAVAVAGGLAADAEQAIVARAFGDEEDQSRAFADSLAAGGWAAGATMPVLLTETGELSEAVGAYLQESSINEVFIVGGTAAVSEGVEAQLTALGLTVNRVAGPTRFHTALAIAEQRGFAGAVDADKVILTEGQAEDAWASGFAAAARSAAENAPIVLSVGDQVPEPTATFLATGAEGEAAAALLCSPSTAEAACTAAAEALGQVPAGGALTFAATSVGRYDYAVGTIPDPSVVNEVRVTGCGYDDQPIYLDEKGTLYLMLGEPSGACSAVFTVDTSNGVQQATVEFTIGDAVVHRSSMQVPELVSVRPVLENEEGVMLRFLFDEPIAPGAGIDHTKFHIHPVEIPEGVNDVTEAARYMPSSIQRDPRNPSAVLAVFRSIEYHRSTVAYVEGGTPPPVGNRAAQPPAAPGAVRDLSGYPNPAGHFGTRALDLTATGSTAPELRALEDYDDADESVLLRFSEEIDVPARVDADDCPDAIGDAQLLLVDGTVKRSDCNGWSAGPDAESVRVTFAGDGLTAADMEQVRRAFVREDVLLAADRSSDNADDAGNPPLAIVVAGGGISSRPDFVDIENPNFTGSGATRNFEATFVFEEALDAFGRDGSPEGAPHDRFVLVLRSGEVIVSSPDDGTPPPDERPVIDEDDPNEVLVIFNAPDPADTPGFDEDEIVYYGVLPDAVRAFDSQEWNFADTIGVDREDVRPAGQTVAPDFTGEASVRYESKTCSPTELSGEAGKWEVVYTFDQGVEDLDEPAETSAPWMRAWYTGTGDNDDGIPRVYQLGHANNSPGDNASVSTGKVTWTPSTWQSTCQAGGNGFSSNDEFWGQAVQNGRVWYLEVQLGAVESGDIPAYPQGKAVQN